MAQIVDVRASGGDLVIVGGALTLPTSNNAVSTPATGSIRYNTTYAALEIFNGSSWAQATGSNSGVTSFNGRTGGVALAAIDIFNALGYTPLGSTTGVGYSSLPASLKYLPFVYTMPGYQPAATQVWTIPVVVAFSLPTNCTGSSAVAAVPAYAACSFTLGYIRAGVPATIGTINFAASAPLATFTTSAYTAQIGDILTLTSPVTQDASLANVGIVVLGTRTT